MIDVTKDATSEVYLKNKEEINSQQDFQKKEEEEEKEVGKDLNEKA